MQSSCHVKASARHVARHLRFADFVLLQSSDHHCPSFVSMAMMKATMVAVMMTRLMMAIMANSEHASDR